MVCQRHPVGIGSVGRLGAGIVFPFAVPPCALSQYKRLGYVGPSTDETVDDLHCVRAVSPDDPELRAFSATPTRTPADMCGFLSVSGLQSRRIAVTRAVPEVEAGTPQCRYFGAGGPFGEQTVLVLQDASTFVPAAYHDRRLPTPAPGGDRLFLVAKEFSTARGGVWIVTSHAPVLLLYIAEQQADDGVLALGRDVQARAG